MDTPYRYPELPHLSQDEFEALQHIVLRYFTKHPKQSRELDPTWVKTQRLIWAANERIEPEPQSEERTP
jgi:hypothetical protein